MDTCQTIQQLSQEQWRATVKAATKVLSGEETDETVDLINQPVFNGIHSEQSVKDAYGIVCEVVLQALVQDRSNYRQVIMRTECRQLDMEQEKRFYQRLQVICDELDLVADKVVQHNKLLSSDIIPFSEIKDVEWRLDYNIRTSGACTAPAPIYLVKLKTEKNAKDLTFTCTLQQLQDFVGKLADAKRQVEKLVT
mmetsp:Transcript_19246/g.31603  ORF Transcript_19246/g.31603 Transcript_19246/m.31603 type:complete len:195 (-) Transcript_19246:567-1151(-)|eukprot:CAMPEP_0203755120 /NCGR_PEP_ID=MMETSP0098-20131031/8623_1 /ASSEMBLY_ACC=CAM_ASM_000208 /TAXON_ID=96639 /ORGANISM=" , Strain NY0313808BC1" /LENGTH=194 /DNA_ID=CAMNT_0050646451 /DNA_START=154 /DNA_END=738 /DNA_ORIENTATION=-